MICAKTKEKFITFSCTEKTEAIKFKYSFAVFDSLQNFCRNKLFIAVNFKILIHVGCKIIAEHSQLALQTINIL